MTATMDTDADLDEIRRDLSNLRRDVTSLTEHFKDETKAANGEQAAKAIGPWIERRPLLSPGVAFGAGYFGTRAPAPRAGPRLRTNSPDSRSPRLDQGSFR